MKKLIYVVIAGVVLAYAGMAQGQMVGEDIDDKPIVKPGAELNVGGQAGNLIIKEKLPGIGDRYGIFRAIAESCKTDDPEYESIYEVTMRHFSAAKVDFGGFSQPVYEELGIDSDQISSDWEPLIIWDSNGNGIFNDVICTYPVLSKDASNLSDEVKAEIQERYDLGRDLAFSYAYGLAFVDPGTIKPMLMSGVECYAEAGAVGVGYFKKYQYTDPYSSATMQLSVKDSYVGDDGTCHVTDIEVRRLCGDRVVEIGHSSEYWTDMSKFERAVNSLRSVPVNPTVPGKPWDTHK
jgi:hypothetical protein